MRRWRNALVVVALVALAASAGGCTKAVTGTAQSDPHTAAVEITDDGYGIRAGFDDAPIEIEIFTEPQCSHCADLQADFGDQIAYFIATGQLAVTYRPVTFLDTEIDGHSARVANALFVAASPSPDGDNPTGPAFQRFVEELWAAQDPGGAGPTDDEMADMARAAGVPDYQDGEIASGDLSFDTTEMSDANLSFLLDIDPIASGTPTVFSLTNDEKLDIYDDDWLSKLMAS
jgi:protein-disulfide isomerase